MLGAAFLLNDTPVESRVLPRRTGLLYLALTSWALWPQAGKGFVASLGLGLLSSRLPWGGDTPAEEGRQAGGQAHSLARGLTPKPQPRGPDAPESCRGQAASYRTPWASASSAPRTVEVPSQPVWLRLGLTVRGLLWFNYYFTRVSLIFPIRCSLEGDRRAG